MNMGWGTTRALLCSPPTGKRTCTEEKGWVNLIRTKTSKLDKTQRKEASKDIPDSETFDNELENRRHWPIWFGKMFGNRHYWQYYY